MIPYYYYLAYEIKKGISLFHFNKQSDNPVERTPGYVL